MLIINLCEQTEYLFVFNIYFNFFLSFKLDKLRETIISPGRLSKIYQFSKIKI